LNPANQYTLRVRVHCPECNRAQAIYYSLGDQGLIAAGGKWAIASGKIQMEIQEFVNGVGATPVTLYDGAVAYLPGSCQLVPASSINLIGTIRAVSLTNLGSGWVVSTPSGGGPYTRRVGTTAEAAECHLERTGKVTKTHRGAHTEFARLSVNEPRIDAELRRFLPQAYDLKALCDYELGPDAVVPYGKADAAVQAATRFVDCIAGLIDGKA